MTASDRSRSFKHTQRARIVLLSPHRLSVQGVARRAGVSRPAVWSWQRHYAEACPEDMLRAKMRRPGTPPYSTETVAKALALTYSELPVEITHWIGRTAAAW
ncbi:helix-turn-helix domain-containing protein [Methylobacterium komagatae]|uniref:Helix-turn-helix domain-containing protein n=1 Tax=Methylobacterium komagatae TaxID=374425 RepID=A0ABW2BNI1_9HYPH